MSRFYSVSQLALASFVFLSIRLPAFAQQGAAAMPWDSPLEKLQKSLTGPTAGAIAVIAIAIAGATLIFGGEIGDFARRMVYVVLVAAVLVGASSIVGSLGLTTAAN